MGAMTLTNADMKRFLITVAAGVAAALIAHYIKTRMESEP